MTIRRGLHVADENGEGADALEARLALAGLFASFGVLDGGTVTGRASWAYNVAAGKFVSSRGPADGAVLFANDSTAIVGAGGEGTTVAPAPATGSRIDIIYALHRDVDNGDADSLPVFGVASGVASGSPVAPTIPAGAIELGRATVSAGATNTAHANVTISHADAARAILRGAAADRGTLNFSTAPIVAGGVRQVAITFSRTLPSVPIIQCTFQTFGSGTGPLIPKASDITTAGFNLNIYNTGSTTASPANSYTVGWTATL